MPTEYDRDKVVECMFDSTTSLVISELEDNAKSCAYLANAASITEQDVLKRLSYLIECEFISKHTDESTGKITLEANSKKLSEIVEDSSNFDATVDGLAKMDSYLN